MYFISTSFFLVHCVLSQTPNRTINQWDLDDGCRVESFTDKKWKSAYVTRSVKWAQVPIDWRDHSYDELIRSTEAACAGHHNDGTLLSRYAKRYKSTNSYADLLCYCAACVFVSLGDGKIDTHRNSSGDFKYGASACALWLDHLPRTLSGAEARIFLLLDFEFCNNSSRYYKDMSDALKQHNLGDVLTELCGDVPMVATYLERKENRILTTEAANRLIALNNAYKTDRTLIYAAVAHKCLAQIQKSNAQLNLAIRDGKEVVARLMKGDADDRSAARINENIFVKLLISRREQILAGKY